MKTTRTKRGIYINDNGLELSASVYLPTINYSKVKPGETITASFMICLGANCKREEVKLKKAEFETLVEQIKNGKKSIETIINNQRASA